MPAPRRMCESKRVVVVFPLVPDTTMLPCGRDWVTSRKAPGAILGISGAAAALVSAVSGYLVYQYARARGQWGTDEPPAGTSEEVGFTSSDDNVNISGWFFRAAGAQPGPAIVLCHGVWTGR